MQTAIRSSAITAWIPPLTAGLIALAIGRVYPLASPLLVALILGAIVVNTPLRSHALLNGHQAATKLLLRIGVVMLGLRLPLQDIIDLGPRGLVVIFVTVAVTFSATCFIGDRLGVERGLVTLIASGFSICGASAIAAVESGIRRRNEDVALAIAMVTLFGSAMIVILPLSAGLLGLSDQQVGVWAGASIHEVAQVVAAATTAGAAAVAIATTIKLGRVALLAAAYVAARRRDSHDDSDGDDFAGDLDGDDLDGAGVQRPSGKTPLIPWFVIGFAIAAGIRTADFLPTQALNAADVATTLLLAAAMFGLGLGMNVRTLFPVPPRVFVLSACSTVVAAAVSLALTVALF